MEIQNSFLLDEVRNGFLIPAAVKQAWAAELEVLAEIDRVCKKHNIQYFADWGTLLGAVRHGGFVPWDDDLDIVMKRDDYIKFLNVARHDMSEGFDVQTYRNHEDCWLFMGKVVGRNGFSFEKEHLRRFHNFPYIACVDIFVLDYVHRDPEKEEKRRKLCKYILGVADTIAEGNLTSGERESRLQTLETMYGKKLRRIEDVVELRRYLYGEVEKIFAEVPESDADFLTQLFPRGLLGDAFQFPKEFYEQAVYLPFECTYMPVPAMYDKMLQMRYGDYLRLVKNRAGHDYPYFEGQKKNLQKVLDFKLPEFELNKSKLLRSEEEEAYQKLSYKEMAKECLEELQRFCDLIPVAVSQGDVEQAVGLLQTSQQLAVDLGNMLEAFLAEENGIIPLLEQYCEAIYVLYEGLMEGSVTDDACGALVDILENLTVELEKTVWSRRVALFLPVLGSDWSGLQGLWQEAVKSPSWDVYVVPLPYYYKDYDGSPREVCYDGAEFPEEVGVLDYKLLTPEYLEMLHPEVVFIQNPYDSWNPAVSVPEMFYAENIRKYTDKLVYVPPFWVEEYTKRNEREYHNMKYYVTMPGVVYADRVLVASENMRSLYVEKLAEFAGEETIAVWEQRVIRNEWQASQQEKSSSDTSSRAKKRMLYGISIGPYLQDAEVVRRKVKNSIDIFEEYKDSVDLSVVIYGDEEGTSGIRSYISELLQSRSGEILDAGAECCAQDYDAYYGDAMPLVMEFREAGIPVMIQDIENVK
ncbi:MAG: LicD family protein [Lachnospiraceae bacterium]|nr:LicD family protein [Lachnospiraceae bacterium]